MTHEHARHIPVDEFATNVRSYLGGVMRDGRELVVEDENGRTAVLKPGRVPRTTGRRRTGKPTEEDLAAFRAAAGGWKDVDTDKLLEAIAESRALSTRDRLEL